MPALTRNEMEAVITGGGSVIYNGQTISRLGDLPSAADLAKGDPEAEAAAANALQQQIADLQAQIAKLTQGNQPSSGSASLSLDEGTLTTPGLVDTFGQQVADRLAAAGYDTPEKLRGASDADLLAIEGIGDGTLKKIRATYK